MRDAREYTLASAQKPSVAVEITVDGGAQLGYGHIGRCLALAEELGPDTVFRATDPGAMSYLRSRGAVLEDAESRVAVIDRAQGTSAVTVRAHHAEGRKVCLIDDLGAGRRDADIVVDPPTAASWPPVTGQRLAGFAHVLLRREIRQARGAEPRGDHVLVAMGGSDPAGLTVPIAEALAVAGVETVVATGPGYSGPMPRAAEISDPDTWPSALAQARLAITGYGHSLLEAAYLGVPAISVVFKPEHAEHMAAFCAHGTAIWVDMTAGERAASLARRVGALLARDCHLEEMSSRGRDLIDGRGAARVAVALGDLL